MSPTVPAALSSPSPRVMGLGLAIGAGWVGYGIASTRLFSQSLWEHPRGSLVTVAALAVLAFAMERLASRRGIPLSWTLLATAATLAVAFAGIGATAALLLTLAAGFALGCRVVDACACEGLHPVVAIVAPTALGLALIAAAVNALALTPFNNPVVYAALLLAAAGLGWRGTLARAAALASAWRRDATAGARWERLAWITIAVACGMRLLAALHPEIGTDALAAHLVIADRLRESGRFHFDVTQSLWALMPMAADWLLAVPYMLAGEMGSRLANVCAEWLVLGLAWGSARQWLGSRAATIAALVLGTTPLLYRESSTIFIENLWTLWLVASLVFASLTLEVARWRPVAASAVLIGTALAAKVMTVFWVGFYLCLAVAWLRRDAARGVRATALAAVVALAFGLGPYLNAWWHTGNPVFPFMNSLFGSPLFEQADFDNVRYSGGIDWRTPFAMHFESANFLEGRNGAMGLLFLLALPASLLALPRLPVRLRWGFACALAAICGVFAFQHYLRYILPALPVLAVVAGAALSPLFERRATAIAAAVVLLLGAVANLWLAAASTWQYARVALPPLAGSRAADEYRQRNVPETFAVGVLNAAGARRVLWVAQPAIANARADVFVTNWHGWNVAQQLRAIGDVPTMQRWIAANHLDAIVIGPGDDQPDASVLQAFVDRHAERIGALGDVAVYAVSPEAMFLTELLTNPGLDEGAGGWVGEGRWTAAGSVRVSVDRPLVQPVAVVPGADYLLEVEPVCGRDPIAYRLQVNWQDAGGAMIAASIQVRACGGSTRPWVVTAPARAAKALVYASAHAPGETVEVTRISFKR